MAEQQTIFHVESCSTCKSRHNQPAMPKRRRHKKAICGAVSGLLLRIGGSQQQLLRKKVAEKAVYLG
jgi:hypothetical protein